MRGDDSCGKASTRRVVLCQSLAPGPAALLSHVWAWGPDGRDPPSLPFTLQPAGAGSEAALSTPRKPETRSPPGSEQSVRRGPPGHVEEPVMGHPWQLCHPQARGDWGRKPRLRARTSLDSRRWRGVHPLLDTGNHLPEPKRLLSTALWSPVNACRHGHTRAHLAHEHHTSYRTCNTRAQDTHVPHASVHTPVYTCAHHTHTPATHSAHTHAHATRGRTPHTHAWASGLSEATLPGSCFRRVQA